MSSIREEYFKAIKLNSPYLTPNVIRALLMRINCISSDVEFSLSMEKECENPEYFQKMVDKIVEGYPYQYLINHAYFANLDLYVDPNVLIPRNETEEMVFDCIKYIKENKMENLYLADVCCGSGCIALAMKHNFPNMQVYGTDISSGAIGVSELNKDRLKLDVNFLLGNLVEPLKNISHKFDILISNPPYILNRDEVDQNVLNNEPSLALFSDPQEYFYEEIIKDVPSIMNESYFVAFEIDPALVDVLSKLVNKYLPTAKYEFKKDIYNNYRFLYIMKA